MSDGLPPGALTDPAPTFGAPQAPSRPDTLIVSLRTDSPAAKRLRARGADAAPERVLRDLLSGERPPEATQVLEDLAGPLEMLQRRYRPIGVEPMASAGADLDTLRASREEVGGPRWATAIAAESLIAASSDRRAGIVCVRLPADELPRAATALRAHSQVERVSVPAERWLCAAPSPSRNLQWGLRAIGYFGAPRQLARERVQVAMLDSGVEVTHPAFAEGRVHLDTGIWDADDPSGHGTHVAGLLCAVADDAVGTAGVLDSRRSHLAIWRITPDQPSPDGVWRFDSTVYLRALQAVESMDPPPEVLNLSLAGAERDEDEEDTIAAIAARGTVVVCASGNGAQPRPDEPMYPAMWPQTIAVGAITENQCWWRHACFGDHLDLVAPGTNVLSTVPTTPALPWRTDVGAMTMSGTSFAAPLVAGTIARLRARDPSLTPEDVRMLLRRHSRRLPEMGGDARTPMHGSGCLDVGATLRSVDGTGAVPGARGRRRGGA